MPTVTSGSQDHGVIGTVPLNVRVNPGVFKSTTGTEEKANDTQLHKGMRSGVQHEARKREARIEQNELYSNAANWSRKANGFRIDDSRAQHKGNAIYQVTSIYDQLVLQLKQLCASSRKDPAMKELAICVLKLACVWKPDCKLGTSDEGDISGCPLPAPTAVTVCNNLCALYNEDPYDTKKAHCLNPLYTRPHRFATNPWDEHGAWEEHDWNPQYAASAAHQPSTEELECVVDRLEAIRLKAQDASCFADALALVMKQACDGLINVHTTMERYIAQYCRMVAFSNNNEVTKLLFKCILTARKIKLSHIPVYNPNPCDDVMKEAATL